MIRRGLSAFACALVTCAAAACGSPQNSDSGQSDARVPVLTWHVGPDRADAASLARACEQESAGRFEVEIEELPADVDERRTELIGRLEAQDPSIDLFSMDLSLADELAQAQVLAPVPEDLKEPFAEGVAPAALDATTVDGLLVAAPWWFDPYLLWWRGATAERAGLDPSEPITWDALLEAAQRTGQPIAFDDTLGDGLGVWIAALVAGAGGELLDGSGRAPVVGLDSAGGRRTAEILGDLARSGVGRTPSDAAPAEFARAGGFLLAPSSLVGDPDVALVAGDLDWTAFPLVEADAEGVESAVPAVGAALAVPLFAPRTDLSYELISCLTSEASLGRLMTSSGHSAARLPVYDTQAVAEGYPLTEVTRPAIDAAVTVPASAYWSRVRAGLERTWSPLSSVTPGTPARSQRVVEALVDGRLP